MCIRDRHHSGETLSLIHLLLGKCGDNHSVKLLKELDPGLPPFIGEKVKPKDRKKHNLRCLLVQIASKLKSDVQSDMVTLLKFAVGNIVPRNTNFQTILELFERARQKQIISPTDRDKLKEWLGESGVDQKDLVDVVDRFDPNETFAGQS